jgi:hypothetical protein
MPVRLHDWLYEIVAAVCFDRDYLYLAFYRHFTGLLADVTAAGAITDRGEYVFPGMKSNLQVRVTWQLARRLTWIGPNVLTLVAAIETLGGGSASAGANEVLSAQFDLSTGDEV